MSATTLIHLWPPLPTPVTPSVVISMEHWRDAKIQIQTDAAPVSYVLEASVVDLPDPSPWPAVLAGGELQTTAPVILHVQTHYPWLRLTFTGATESISAWICFSDRMQN